MGKSLQELGLADEVLPTAGQELEALSRGMDYVFVLDVSGSMGHDGKLGLSRKSIGVFLDALGSDDRFEIITFNVATSPLFNRKVQKWVRVLM